MQRPWLCTWLCAVSTVSVESPQPLINYQQAAVAMPIMVTWRCDKLHISMDNSMHNNPSVLFLITKKWISSRSSTVEIDVVLAGFMDLCARHPAP
ncbi:hypothetical protein BD289DRAFT_280233 [Coniella lustricola]|uniref:Secreted protein n=1 Tax=Coniella lustricola TaxID=2025994 RepID=A0A2T3A629_9PEZI|nr:hypothetical protein BD289DRAFT_280233 [Coniella lustricola]